jgi:hypothetical protein
MWTATTIGFFSVVRDRQTTGGVLVRARAKADIWNLYRGFSTAYKGKGKRYKMTRPRADENRDYRWRVAMRKTDWAKIVYRLAMGIHYCNFKDEVHKHPDQANKNSAYLSVWSAMLRVQHGEDPDYKPQSQITFAWQRELDYAALDGSHVYDDVKGVPFEEQPDAMLENMKASLRIHELSDDQYKGLHRG